MGKVHVPPALETRDLHLEQRRQTAILRQEIYRIGLRQQLDGLRTVCLGGRAQYPFDEQGIVVVGDGRIVRQSVQPVRRLLQQRRQPPDLLPRFDRRKRSSLREVGERPLERAARLAQQGADLPWQLTRRSELGGVLPVARRGRVVDEEHDSAVGRLLQYGREQRLAYDARFLLVGGDQDRQCRRIAGMDTVQGRSGLGTMRREPFQVSQPRDLVDQAGEQEKADQALPDEQVGCLRPFGSLEKPDPSDPPFDGEGEDGDQGASERDVADWHLVPEGSEPFPVERAGMAPCGKKVPIHVVSPCV